MARVSSKKGDATLTQANLLEADYVSQTDSSNQTVASILDIGKRAADPNTDGWGEAEKGLMWHNTTEGKYKYWNGASIVPFPVTGGTGAPTDASYVTINAEDGLDAEVQHANITDEAQKHVPKLHTLASHSTKAHSELTGVTAHLHHRVEETASYIIFKDGSDYYAKNGQTGVIDYGGSGDAGDVDGASFPAVMNAVYAALTGGGLVFIKKGTYTVNAKITVPNRGTATMGENMDKTFLSFAAGGEVSITATDFIEFHNLNIEGSAGVTANFIHNDDVSGRRYGFVFKKLNMNRRTSNYLLSLNDLEMCWIQDCQFGDVGVRPWTADAALLKFYSKSYHVGSVRMRDCKVGPTITAGAGAAESGAGILIINTAAEHGIGLRIANSHIYSPNGEYIDQYGVICKNNFGNVAGCDLFWNYFENIRMVRTVGTAAKGVKAIHNTCYSNVETSVDRYAVDLDDQTKNAVIADNQVDGTYPIRVLHNSAATRCFVYLNRLESGSLPSFSAVTRIWNNENYVTENIVYSDAFAIDAVALKTLTMAHGCDFTPYLPHVQLTVIEDTDVDDWGYDLLKVDSVDATNVVAKIHVSIASATGGATAKLSMRIGRPY